METPISTKRPRRGLILLCRLFLCGVGAVAIGGGIYLFYHTGCPLAPEAIVYAVMVLLGLGIICLGIFADGETCMEMVKSFLSDCP